MMAAEMAVIRMTHVADLPDPESLMRRMAEGPGPSAPVGRGPAPSGPTAQAAPRAGVTAAPAGNGAATALARAPEVTLARYASFPAVVELIRANRDVKLLLEVENHLRLVHYAPGRIEFEPTQDAPRDLAQTLGQRLQGWTGVRWGVSVVSGGGAPTIAEDRDARTAAAKDRARDNPLVQAVFAAFPEARIVEVRTPAEIEARAGAEALPEAEDDSGAEWDPFEEE
jgi:DNA polymerase-3 subunit gamma/tau